MIYNKPNAYASDNFNVRNKERDNFFCFDLRDDLRRLRLKTSSSVPVEKIYMMEYVPIVSKRPIWKKKNPKTQV